MILALLRAGRLAATGAGVLAGAPPAPMSPPSVAPAASRSVDTVAAPAPALRRTGPDSARASADDEASDPARLLTAGLAVGTVSYYGGRTERAVSATLRLAPRSWLAFAVTPTALSSHEPSATGGAQRFTGLADLPVTLELGRALPLPGAPTVGVTYTMVVPVGDTAAGFGAGQLGASLGATVGLSPVPHLSLSVGGGRALAGLSPRTAFDANAASWGDAGLSAELGQALELSAGYGRDLGRVDPTFGRNQTVSGGVTVRVPRLWAVRAVNVAAAHALSGAGPQWSVALGVGAASSALDAVARGHSPVQALVGAFGAGPHGLPSSTWPGHAGTAPGHGGTTPGKSGQAPGHGRGHHP